MSDIWPLIVRFSHGKQWLSGVVLVYVSDVWEDQKQEWGLLGITISSPSGIPDDNGDNGASIPNNNNGNTHGEPYIGNMDKNSKHDTTIEMQNRSTTIAITNLHVITITCDSYLG